MREILLNGYIDDDVWFGDEITPDALHSLLYADGKDTNEDIHIRLNSYGGSCNAAVRMHDDIVAYPGKVNITISGTAASAATVMSMAADHLDMTPGSLFMIHDPSIVAIGNVHDLKDAIHLLEACKESILNVYETRIKITRDQADSMMTKTTWMDAQKALEDGFIDSVLSVKQAGPTDCIIPLADAEKKVQAWIDRHKANASARRDPIPTKEGILYEAPSRIPDSSQVPQMEEKKTESVTSLTEEVSTSPPEDRDNDSSTIPPVEISTSRVEHHGTPVSQLQKRLALIMPPEAKNKEKKI